MIQSTNTYARAHGGEQAYHSVVTRYHVYTDVWITPAGKQLILKREHGYKLVENTMALRRTVSSSVTYLKQLHPFRGSFSIVVSTSFAGSWESGGMVTVLKFCVFISFGYTTNVKCHNFCKL